MQIHTDPETGWPDVDTVAFWLSTVMRFLSDLKQYSGLPKYEGMDFGRPLGVDLSAYYGYVVGVAV